MHMRYFHYIAEQAFKTTPDGRRFFYRGGPWSRPYLVPDPETEQRLFTKQLWMMRVLLGGMISGSRFYFFSFPTSLTNRCGSWGTWRSCLRFSGLSESSRFTMNSRGFLVPNPACRYTTSILGRRQQHSVGKLILLILASFAFVVAGFWMLSTGQNAAIAWLAIVFFGLCALAWAYTLILKVTER